MHHNAVPDRPLARGRGSGYHCFSSTFSFAIGVLGLLLFSGPTANLFAQNAAAPASGPATWTQLESLPNNRPAKAQGIRARKYKALELNHGRMRQLLNAAPHADAQVLRESPAIIALPMPDGSLARFRYVESPVMAPELAAQFPEIKTYFGEGVDDPQATVRFDLTPAGFHAQMLSPNGAVYIDPAFRGESGFHTSYFKRDHVRPQGDFRCLLDEQTLTAGRGAGGFITRSPERGGNGARIDGGRVRRPAGHFAAGGCRVGGGVYVRDQAAGVYAGGNEAVSKQNDNQWLNLT